ncbi:uncharacterized protein LOC132700934 [Cylas formicarius]|uniref:uncharacterized protein LOC132700934 n=1 Tax=Cylas formicarius TaxID=197179 RepID=UPI0029588A74|nr:uncharacterized protein LOC132700934 [Cylas formicarius]
MGGWREIKYLPRTNKHHRSVGLTMGGCKQRRFPEWAAEEKGPPNGGYGVRQKREPQRIRGGGKPADRVRNPVLNLNQRKQKQKQKTDNRKLIFGTWNIQGWRTKGKEVIDVLKTTELDILVVSQTKKKGNGTEIRDDVFYCWSGVKKEERANAAIGDFNGRTGRKENDAIIGRFGEDTVNTNGEALIELCEFNNLKITNGFYRHKEIHKFTWVQETRDLRSIIDYIVVKNNSSIKIKDVLVKRGAECGTDHRLLIAKMEFPWSWNKQQKFNIQLLHDKSIRYLYQRRIDQKLEEFSLDDLGTTYEHIKTCIKEVATEALGEKEESQNQHKIDINKDLTEIINEKKELYMKWLNTKTDEDREIYRKKNREVKRIVQKEKNNKWEEACKNVEQYIGGTRNSKSWRLIKSLRTNRKEKVHLEYIPDTMWEIYYKKLLTEDRPTFIGENSETTSDEQKDIDLSLEESNKWRTTTKRVDNCIYDIDILKRRPCENYKGISVISSMGRLYGKLVKAKLEIEIKGKIGEEQTGFTAGRSCIDHIYSLQQMIEKKMAKNRAVHLAFIDLKKAYDTIPRGILWKAMKTIGLPQKINRDR